MNSPTPAIAYINQPTAPMRASGIKDWSKLDVELWKLVNAWPHDLIPNRNNFYRWARLIRNSVSKETAVKVCDNALIEVLQTVVPRFPQLNSFQSWDAFRSADGKVLELIANLDDTTRLALACIYWRWGQVVSGIECWRRMERWAKEGKERLEKQKSEVVFKLRPEYMCAIDGFRRRFLAGQNATDVQVAWFFFRAAFLIPDQIRDAVRRVISYSDAEGLSQDDAIRAMVIATQRSMNQERRVA